MRDRGARSESLLPGGWPHRRNRWFRNRLDLFRRRGRAAIPPQVYPFYPSCPDTESGDAKELEAAAGCQVPSAAETPAWFRLRGVALQLRAAHKGRVSLLPRR